MESEQMYEFRYVSTTNFLETNLKECLLWLFNKQQLIYNISFVQKNSDLHGICQEKFDLMYPSSHESEKKCMEYINMAYEECFKLAMHEEKSRTIRDWFHDKFPIFSFFRKMEKGDLDGDKHSLTVASCRRLFSNIVSDYMDIMQVFDDRNKQPDNRLVWILLAIGVFVVVVLGTTIIRWMMNRSVNHECNEETNSSSTCSKDTGFMRYFKFPKLISNNKDEVEVAIENDEKLPPPLLREDTPYTLRVKRNSTLFDMVLAKVRRGLNNNWAQTCQDEKRRAVYKLITSSSYIEIELQKPKFSETIKSSMSVCEMQIIPVNGARPPNTCSSVSRKSPETNSKSIFSITTSRHTTSSPNPRSVFQIKKALSPPVSPSVSPPASPTSATSRYLQPRKVFSKISKTEISTQPQHKYLMKNKINT